MVQSPSYYDILQVSPQASYEVISSAYRTLMGRMRKHPDLGGDTAEAALINEAYQTLSDPLERSSYDLQLHRKKKEPLKSPVVKPSGDEKRRAPRRDVNKLISYCLENKSKWIPALVRDSSTLGVRIQSHEPIFEGENIILSPSDYNAKPFRGTVRWTRMFHPSVFERVYEAGVEFATQVPDIDQRLSV